MAISDRGNERVSGSDLARLIVSDGEDLNMLSSLLQDATVLIGDMGYDQKAGQFLFVAARHMTQSPGEMRRRLMGVHIGKVQRLQRKGFSPNDRDDVLNLLAIRAEGTMLELVFSGAAMVRLECEGINVYAADLGEGWQTHFQPIHDTDQPDLQKPEADLQGSEK